MTELKFYGDRPPGIEGDVVPGRLIVIEATDRAGRSTQVSLLKEWIEEMGYAVLDTGLVRSDLAGPGIKRAKEGHTLDAITLNLFYATDFWDRLERQILPGLRAGMVVLADRYIFSLIARAAVRGVSVQWMEDLYGFALVPDRVIYLDIDVDHLLPRVVGSTGFDYWESGQDFLPNGSVYDSFVEYQRLLLAEFRRLAERHDFSVVNARESVADVFRSVRAVVEEVIRDMGTEAGLAAPDLIARGSEAPPA
ncbi:MAG: thymidylate kinase [Actinomycetota bacterium]|nr:thymidylate kinase [Actinomycetota bacterium]